MNPFAKAFVDEMEKIAGLPSAVRRGGGGAMGEYLRKAHQAGRDAARSRAILKGMERTPPIRGPLLPGIEDAYGKLPPRVVPTKEWMELGRHLSDAAIESGKKHKRTAMRLFLLRSIRARRKKHSRPSSPEIQAMVDDIFKERKVIPFKRKP